MQKTIVLKIGKILAVCSALILAGCLVHNAQNDSDEAYIYGSKSAVVNLPVGEKVRELIYFQSDADQPRQDICSLNSFEFNSLLNSLDQKCHMFE